MHHVDLPASVIAEMFRVARKAVLISDHNNFAFGTTMARRIRLVLYSCGLFGIAAFVKQDSVANDIRKTTGGGILTRF